VVHKSNATLVTAGRDRGVSFDFVNPPLVRGSTVLHDSIEGIHECRRRREPARISPS
jgi:hypothetical protein